MTDLLAPEPSIHVLMARVAEDIGAVAKGGKNKEQGYAFRGIDQFMNAAHPALVKHGVFCCPEVLTVESETRPTKSGGVSINRLMTIRYTFYGPAGDSVSCVMVGEAADTFDKTSNKCMSQGYKYALMQVFCIPLESEQDGDGTSPDMGTLAPPRQQRQRRANRDISEAELKLITDVFDGMPDEERLAKKMGFVAMFGKPDELTRDQVPEALAYMGLEAPFMEEPS